MTDARVTQAALEQWITTHPQAQITQAALEQWITAHPQVQVTQVAIEMWASVALSTSTPSASQARVMIMA